MGAKRAGSIAAAAAAEPLHAEVPETLAGMRLDAAAAALFPDFSRARIKTWIEAGRLRLNDIVTERARQPVNPGDRLALEPVIEVETEQPAQAIALDIVHADRAIAVINKPPGLAVHPGAGRADSTLQNALLHRFPQVRGVPRAGLIHRLDKDTSGLLVVALTLAAHTHLTEAMARREIRREYDALVAGVMTGGGTVDAPLGRHPTDRLRQAVIESGRPAVTHYRVSERFVAHSLLRVKLETGRTHQIRVHMAHLRHPIVGDSLYGGRGVRGQFPPPLRERLQKFPRQALHARELELLHPVSGKSMRFEAPLPRDMSTLIAALRAHAKDAA